MTFFEFAGKTPVLTMVLALFALLALCEVTSTVFRIVNRTLRAQNIKRHGWPPEHCDADGDFRPVPKEDSDECA